MASKDDQARVLGDIRKPAAKKGLKKADTQDKSKLPRKSVLTKQIKAEAEADMLDKTHAAILEDVVRDHSLKKTETVDKTAVPGPEEMKAIIEAEKKAYKEIADLNHKDLLGELTKGAPELKKAETVDKSQIKSDELKTQIKIEKQMVQTEQARAKLLEEVPGEHKLKKAETKDSSVLSKDTLLALLAAEKEGKITEDQRNQLLVAITKSGRWKLKKTKTRDASRLAIDDIQAQIKEEKQAQQFDKHVGRVLTDITKERQLKKVSTTESGRLPTVDDIKAEKEADKFEFKINQLLSDIAKSEHPLRKTVTKTSGYLPTDADIKAEKEAESLEGNINKLFEELQQEHGLKKTATKEAGRLPTVEEIKAEKEAAQLDQQLSSLLGQVLKAPPSLKPTDSKTVALPTYEDIVAEKEGKLIDEQFENLSKLLSVITDGAIKLKLKKTVTVDKSRLEPRDLHAQIKIEKQILKAEEGHSKIQAEVVSGDKKLKHSETVDKSALPSGDQLKALIEEEKKGYKQINDLNLKDLHGELAKGAPDLKKVEVVNKSDLPSKEELVSQIKAEKQVMKTEQAHEKVVADLASGDKKLKKASTSETAKLPTIEEIFAEKEADWMDQRVGDVLSDLTQKFHPLSKVETQDKASVDTKELRDQIKIEKQLDIHDKVVEAVASGDKKLKKTETVDKAAVPGPEQMKAIIEAEKKGYKDVNDLALKDIHGELARGTHDLKKAETKDKATVDQKEIGAQIKIEKQLMSHDKVVEEVASGEKKLKKAETVDKTVVPSGDALKSIIEAEKKGYKEVNDLNLKDLHSELAKGTPELKKSAVPRSKLPTKDDIKAEKEANLQDERVGKVLADVTKEHALKKAETRDKTQLPGKEELAAQIQAEKARSG